MSIFDLKFTNMTLEKKHEYLEEATKLLSNLPYSKLEKLWSEAYNENQYASSSKTRKLKSGNASNSTNESFERIKNSFQKITQEVDQNQDSQNRALCYLIALINILLKDHHSETLKTLLAYHLRDKPIQTTLEWYNPFMDLTIAEEMINIQPHEDKQCFLFANTPVEAIKAERVANNRNITSNEMKWILSNNALRSIRINEGLIKKYDLPSIAQALELNESLTSISISPNLVDNATLPYIADMIYHNTTLTHIRLHWKKATNDNLKALAEAFEKNTSLTNINLSETSFKSDVYGILSSILKVNSPVTSLNLSSCKINDDLLTTLSACMHPHTRLTKLDLSSNNIGATGITSLSNILRNNHSIKHLNLSYNIINDPGFRILSSALSRNTTLEEINLRGNMMHNDGVKVLCEALIKNNTLLKINLSNNFFDDDCADDIACMLKTNKTLASLSLINRLTTTLIFPGANSTDGIKDVGIRKIAEALAENNSLRFLFVEFINDNDTLEIFMQNKSLLKISRSRYTSDTEADIALDEHLKNNGHCFKIEVMARLLAQGNRPEDERKGLLIDEKSGKRIKPGSLVLSKLSYFATAPNPSRFPEENDPLIERGIACSTTGNPYNRPSSYYPQKPN